MSQPSEVSRGFQTFPYRGLSLVDGDGATVRDAEGRTHVDAGGASYGTANVGHRHPRVLAALDGATEGLLHTSQTFAHPERSALVDELVAFTGAWAARAFLSNSGTEAIETAIKTAIAHTGRSRLVAFESAFHGRTLGALAATHRERFRAPFLDRLGETTFVPYGDADALEDALGPDVAAVLVEPVQGEAGVRVPPDGFLADVVERTRDAGALSIVDEVQTGLGRTGRPLAIHREDAEPDLVCLAKSLAAGLPLGATIAHERVEPLDRGQHGTTFGGSPPLCRVARAVLGIVEDEALDERAREQGQRLRRRLEAIEDPLVEMVRGRGLMLALGLQVRATPVLQAMQAQRVLALPGGRDAVRLLPPLIVDDATVDRIVDVVETAIARVRERYATEAHT